MGDTLCQFREDIEGRFQQGIFFTTSRFSTEAKDSSLQVGQFLLFSWMVMVLWNLELKK
ncbi:hypothetical protein [Epilithonimonas bovis]|uniref:hypothetical protein n=1 Tax=Epilithonimonas bovis TaxID=421530 RepID=UPI00135637C9|nr:hypothetical protein [Epilithonimonas bovis]